MIIVTIAEHSYCILVFTSKSFEHCFSKINFHQSMTEMSANKKYLKYKRTGSPLRYSYLSLFLSWLYVQIEGRKTAHKLVLLGISKSNTVNIFLLTNCFRKSSLFCNSLQKCLNSSNECSGKLGNKSNELSDAKGFWQFSLRMAKIVSNFLFIGIKYFSTARLPALTQNFNYYIKYIK